MVSREQINTFCEDIARKFGAEKIILFGSYAYGKPRADSDVDLLVVMPFKGNNIQKGAELLRATNPGFAVDMLVRTPEEFEQRLRWNDFFMREIVERGTVVYPIAG
jgi:predicted nucleotidyltransferase